jgi:hypothetical protein
MTSVYYRGAGLAFLLAVSGSATSAARAMQASGSGPALDPIAFFTGRTQGEGELDKLFSSPVKLLVESVGKRQGDTLILDQRIREGAKAPRVRRWTMQRVAPNSYTGSLTDAEGPVHVTVEGPRAQIRYTMPGGLKVDQKLTLQSNGRTLLNRLQVTKLGMRVATVDETIHKLD